MNKHKFSWGIIFLLLTGFALIAYAALPKIAWYPDPVSDAELNKSVTFRDLRVQNTGNELYNASYYHDALMDDGTAIYSQFFIHNLGLGSNHPSADLTIIEPNGKVHRQTDSFDKMSFENPPDKFRIAFGDYVVEGSPEAKPAVYHLKNQFGDKLGVDLTYTCEAPAFFDKGIYFNGDKNNYQKWVTYCPRGAVAGKITIDGKTRQVKGRGFADHAASNPALSTGMSLIQGMGIFIRGSTPDLGFSLMESRPMPNAQGLTMPGLLVNIGDRNVIFTREYKLELDGWTNKGNGQFPTVFRIQIDKPALKLKAEIKMERFLLSGSTLEGVNSKTVRAILSKLAGDSRWARFVSSWKFDYTLNGKEFAKQGKAITQVIFAK